MTDSAQCPRCGAPLTNDAPEGLCPRCLSALPLSPETVLTGENAAASRPPLTPEEIAPHFPQLEIMELLGRGGMGVVYKARQRSLDRCVALKLLAPERIDDPDFSERFAREAQALARLTHPGIVAVHDFGEAGGFFYLLMEFVDGVNLRRALSARHFTPEEAIAMVPPICEALQYAHERGIVHRDIKPENLLLDRAGRVKIADFGIAKILGAAAQAAEERAAGTPGYMAPEQKETPDRADSRADIYSLGVVFYEMLTGELPAKQIEPPSRKVQVDVRIDEIVLRALEKEPELRFQTASELRTEVENVAVPPTPKSPPAPSPVENDRTANPAFEKLYRQLRFATGVLFLATLTSYGATLLCALLGFSHAVISLRGVTASLAYVSVGLLSVLLVASVVVLVIRNHNKGTGALGGSPPEKVRAWLLIAAASALPLLILAGFNARRTGSQPRSAASSVVKAQHGIAHIETEEHGVYFDQDAAQLYFVIFHAGGFDPSASRTQSEHRPNGTWTNNGDVTTKGGRFFSFRRDSSEPDTIKVNGADYDLRKGRVLDLRNDGTVKHLPLFPASVSLQSLPTLAAEIAKAEVLPTARALTSHPSPTFGKSRGAAPGGAAFTVEQQVVVPQESRVTVELFRKVNDGERSRLGDKFTFKTALGSGLGVLLRWHGYGPEHPTHANRWVLDLIDPQNGTIFHRSEEGFPEPVTMTPIEGAAPGEGTHTTLERAGSSAFLRLLRANRVAPPGEPIRAWWEVQAFVTLGAENQEGDPPLFQLPSSPAPTATPGLDSDHGSPAHVVSADDSFTVKATEVLQRLPKREFEIGPEEAVAEAAIQLAELFPGVDSIANITELRSLLEKRAQGVENVSETIYWLLGFREKVRAQAKPTVVEKVAQGPKWLIGKWTFDLAYTKEKLAEAEKDKAPGKIADLANALVTPQLISALEGSNIAITDTNFAMTTKDGNGKSYTYEVLEVPDADTVTVKMSDGEINTFHREGKRFWITSTGTINIRAYFTRDEGRDGK